MFKRLSRNRCFLAVQKCTSLFLILIFAFSNVGSILNISFLDPVPEAQAVQLTLDNAASANGTSHIMSGSQTVFTDDQTGYKFFRDRAGYCVYRKTTDAGSNWSATTTVDAQTDCHQITIWYDQWTPGDTGTNIHIATMDAGNDDIWYNRLDTNGDTLLLGTNPVSMLTGSGQGGTSLTEGENFTSITKGTDGTLYAVSNDGSGINDSFIVECSTTCQTNTNWTETGTNPMDLASDQNILMPLSGGSIMLINRDISADLIRFKTWNNITWSASWTTIGASATENATYDVGMAVTVSPNNGDLYLAYIANNVALGTQDEIRTARYTAGAWSTTKQVIRYTEKGITNLAIGLDSSNDDIYVAYSLQSVLATAVTSNIYWKKSVDNMQSWTFEQGPVNSSADDMYGVDLNLLSNERMFITWFDNTDDDINGDTLVDFIPGVNVTTEEFDEVNSSDAYSQATLDSTADTVGTGHVQSGSQTVFTDDQTGYKFFQDVAGYCVYRKTTNGGTSWSSTTTVDSQTDCHQITVWYDRWTPGDTGTFIHIATMDIGNDDVWYNRLDTTSDTRLLGATPVSVLTGSGQGGTTLTEGENFTSITKGTDGTLYIVSNDGTTAPFDSFVVECSATCQTNTNWTETGTNPMDAASDLNILMPLSGGDIMLINRDVSADDIRYKIWNNSIWSASWTVIDANASENVTYDVGMALTVSSTTGNLYLAYIARNVALGTDDQIRTARYSGGAWATTTDVINVSNMGITNVAIAYDGSNEDIYVVYSGQAVANTANTANILWKKSRDNMVTWSAEQGPMNSTPDDFYGVDVNISGMYRLYATWFDNTDDDIYGTTLIDLPGTPYETTGEQIATVSASTSNVHIGGVFALYNTDDSQDYDVTGITISESGTIDGVTQLDNIELWYEMDTSSPYDCASVTYGGGESQFGSTDTNGFSGSDGISSFSGTTVTIGTTSTLCVYPVMDVLDSANSSSTIEISIANPATDVVVTSSTAGPPLAQNIRETTTVNNDEPTLVHYHWRENDGTQATATSKTNGVDDTSLTSMRQGSTTRLRIAVSNEGNSATPPIQYRLEYASNPGTCDVATGWVDVGAVGGDFDMSDSVHLIDGGNTSNIAEALGGVADENTTFLTPNAGVKDTSSQTGAITLSTSQFVELEYSIVATLSASEGNTYCFRVTDQGNQLFAYDQIPRANIASDILVTVATSTQYATTSIPATNFHVGSSFVIAENNDSRDITSITIAENGTIDASLDLDNIELFYDLDTTSPYNCGNEVYTGGEPQFGSTDTNGFSSANGTSTFTDSVTVSTTSTMCLYVVLDTTPTAQDGETINIIMENPSVNLTVSPLGSISPTITRDLNGSTTLKGAVLTQSRYHWRNDNGTQATATSQTAGIENTPVDYISQTTPVRLRMEVSNEGTVTSLNTALRLEFGTKITTCSDVSTWTDVGAVGGAFDMYNSIHIIEAGNTIDVGDSLGGVTNDNTSFKSPNFAVKDTSSQIATTTFTVTEFLEAEFSLQQTSNAAFDATYCFRLTNAGSEINAYPVYPELTTSPERDFEIQRGTATFSTVSRTLTAGVDYIAPSASSSAFVRITNSHHTGAGDAAGGGTQNADDVTAYISNPSNIMTSFTITRPATALATTTRVSWEIIEFIGASGSDNEMIVRKQGFLTFGGTSLTATGTAVSTITDDSDVVVFVTGQANPDTTADDYNTGQVTSKWLSASNQPAFQRGESNADAIQVSYAVVEFTGVNWKIQRAENTYTLAGSTETKAITAVNSRSKTFLHTQKRIGTNLPGTDEFGHEVWLSSIGAVSFYLEPGATSPTLQTSVAWIIENTQTTLGAMEVYRSEGFTTGGSEPLRLSVEIETGVVLEDLTNASIFTNTRGALTTSLHPRVIAGVTIASSTHYEIWRSDTGARLDYRTEVVEWPTAGLAFRQNDFQFYADNDALDPTDRWPAGLTDIGENAVLTGSNEPLGDGEHIRIRMSLTVLNATFPEQSESFKLQYGQYITSCNAIDEINWSDVGAIGSAEIWRGYNAPSVVDGTPLSIDPPDAGDLNLTYSVSAGTYEEENNSAINPYTVQEGDDIEFDWHVQQNGANSETFYCFRMIKTDGSVLGGYDDWPRLRTSSFTAKSQNWRWYSDVNNETPVSALASENSAPIDLANGSTTKLRVTVKETENIARDDVRFRLQYSEYADFSSGVYDVSATSSCIASSTWCYANGGGSDNVVITTKVLTDADACTAGVGDGCGTHNESPSVATGFRHENSAATEYEFTLTARALRPNAVYYFRLYDVVQDIPVTTNTSESYPSLVARGASLVFSLEGLSSGATIDTHVLDVTSTPTTIPFGTLPFDTDYNAGYRLNINTNATEGYKVLMYANQQLLNSYGSSIPPITGTNAVPTSWATGCSSSAIGCFGYHAGDDSLQGGSVRFGPNDSFAQISTTTPQEVMYSSIPIDDTHDILYRVKVTEEQPAGDYQTTVTYIAVPVF